VPRTVDEPELALRAVLGQQVSTAAARTHAARLVRDVGDAGRRRRRRPHPPVPDAGRRRRRRPVDARAAAARRRTLLGLAAALADGTVDVGPGADRTAARAALLALPGIGPWTVETVAMRALGDPDAFLPTDLGVLAAARALGVDDLVRRAERWAPWRAYAVQHLWGTSDHAVNRLPEEAA
jgi:AraC family transcriptional regulator of adaptative response / DNA-3-methyladenine glycosylase II